MGYLPMYLVQEDVDLLTQMLNQEHQLMFLTTVGRNKWKAVKHHDFTQELQRWGSTGCNLWHIPTDLLNLLQPLQIPQQVHEPFSGIYLIHCQQDGSELLIEADDSASLSEINLSTGVIRLSIRLPQQGKIEKSDFQWAGNHYKETGSPTHPDTVVFWRRLKRLVRKIAVPLSIYFGGDKQIIYTFPNAYRAIQNGQSYSDT
jgi:hypothetical protein